MSLVNKLLTSITKVSNAIAGGFSSMSTAIKADQLKNQGFEQYDAGHFQAALESWQQALRLYRQGYHLVAGQESHVGENREEWNAIISRLGKPFRIGEAISLNCLGDAYYSLRQFQEAIQYYQQAIQIVEEIGDRNWQANYLANLGDAFYSLGESQQATASYEQSLAIAETIEHQQRKASALHRLANICLSRGEFQTAVNYCQQELDIAKEIGEPLAEAYCLNNLGIAYQFLGQYEKAIKCCYEPSLRIAQNTRDSK